NAEAWDALLAPAPLGALRDRLEERIADLDRRASLSHPDQLAYAALWGARGEAHAVPGAIEQAKRTLRDPVAFHDPARYADAVSAADAALRVVPAVPAPLEIDFPAYRPPFALTTPEEIEADAAPERDPFDGWIREVLAPRLGRARLDAVGLSV